MPAGPPIAFFGAALENDALAQELTAQIEQVVRSGELLNGPHLKAFEAAIAARAGRAHAVGVGSATDALFFVLDSLGIGPADEVIVPSFSFAASASAIVRTGAKPVFADIVSADPEPGSAPFTLSLSEAEKALTPATRALVWVGLYGGIADPASIEAFAATHNLALIEDAAQSFGASFGGRPGGRLGIASAFSFDRNKVLGALGTGGAVVTDDARVAAHVRSVRWHGWDGGRIGRLGYNSQLPETSAAALNLKLKHHDAWTARRREIGARYDEALRSLPLQVPSWPSAVGHARHKYVFLTPQRKDLQAYLTARGIPTRRHYDRALPDEPLFAAYGSRFGYAESQRIAEQAISLPIHAFLDDDAVAYIIDNVVDFHQ